MERRPVRTGNRIKQRVEQDEDEDEELRAELWPVVTDSLLPAAAQRSPRGQHGRLEQPEVGNSYDPL